MSWNYQTLKPANADNCPVHLSTKLDRDTASKGDTLHLNVAVENASGKGQGMAVAIIGLPAGLTLPEDMKQLKDLAPYTTTGAGRRSAPGNARRELILYWRDLAPDQKIEVPLD